VSNDLTQAVFESLFPNTDVIARQLTKDEGAIDHVIVSALENRVVVTLGREDFTFNQVVIEIQDGKAVLVHEANIDFLKDILNG
jgi:hypothetical protein